MIVYFTGTGNSRWCAQRIAEKLDDACTDAFPYLRENLGAELFSERPWVFVAPTYAWQAPRIFADFLRASHLSGSRDAYFVLTCGGETGDAETHLAALCRETGLNFRGLAPVVMPDNYLVLFRTPQPDEARAMVEAARPKVDAAAQRILAGEDFPALRPTAADRLKSGPVNEGMYRFFIKTKAFSVSDACVSCGKCAAGCPMNGIDMKDGRPVWNGRCIHCMACICGCPVSAIEYGRASRGKARYQCPDV